MTKNITIAVLVLIVAGSLWFVVEKKPFSSKSVGDDFSASVGDTLDLSNKGLSKVPGYVFDRTALVGLNVSNNKLDGALQSQVGQLKNLKVLNLSNNEFTGVPAEIGQLKNLEILNLSNNKLTGLPNELGNLSNLKLLDLSGNNYSEADLSGIRAKLPASVVIITN